MRLSSHWSHWPLLGIPFLLIMTFPFKKMFRYHLHLTYGGMGFLTFLFVFTLLRDAVYLSTGELYSVKLVLILTFLSLFLGMFNAVKGPRIKNVSLSIEDLSPDLEGLKIAQVSDLHVGATIRRPYVEKVVAKVNSLNADIVTLTGDIGDGDPQEFRSDIEPMNSLKATYGTFYSPGNHEYYWNVVGWLNVMKDLGIMNLVNQGHLLQHKSSTILVGGIPDPISKLDADFDKILESDSKKESDFRMLLSHRPGVAELASSHGFHLQLSGHTHGGQFFPWTIVVKFVHKYSQGLHRVGGMWIYVNPGTGSWGPLIRLGTTPEITLITLKQSPMRSKIS